MHASSRSLLALRACVVPFVGFAAFLAVADFLFWGGAFATVSGHPYSSLQVIGFYSVPCFLTVGGLLVGRAVGGARLRSQASGAEALLAAVLMPGGSCGRRRPTRHVSCRPPSPACQLVLGV